MSATTLRIPILAVVASVAVSVLAGCGDTTVAGKATPAPGRTLSHIATPLTALLPDPVRFPTPYDAVVLPPEAVADATGDLTGVADDAVVDPPHCRPPAQRFGPDQTAILVGTDEDTRTTITVELTRMQRPLTERRDQLTRCSTMRVSAQGATATVKSKLQPPPPVDADETFAVTQTLQSRGAGVTQRQSMLSDVAQVGDVRISVTLMSMGSDSDEIGTTTDTAVLDQVFTDTVMRVKKG